MKPMNAHSSALCLLLGLLLLCCLLPAPAGAGEREDLAAQAAREWLALVDGGDYAASWDQADALLRGATTREQWSALLAGVRGTLGDVAERKLLSATFFTSLPGAPDGEYVVLSFASSFEHKASAVETVTPRLESDGRWRVSGYYLR